MIEQLCSPVDSNDKERDGAGKNNRSLDLRSLPTIVMDAGIVSEENIQWLRDQGYQYIVVSRKRPVYHQMTHRVDGHMTERLVELDELESARTQIFEWAATALMENERRFLLSIKQGKPDWEQLPFDDLDKWPAIQWKLHNIRQMSARSHKAALSRFRQTVRA